MADRTKEWRERPFCAGRVWRCGAREHRFGLHAKRQSHAVLKNVSAGGHPKLCRVGTRRRARGLEPFGNGTPRRAAPEAWIARQPPRVARSAGFERRGGEVASRSRR